MKLLIIGLTTFLCAAVSARSWLYVPNTAFSPASISTWWLRSDLGVTKDGSNKVSAWVDQTGNGNDFTSSGALRPTWSASVLNGQPGITCASSNLAGPAGNMISNSSAFDIIVVLENNNAAAFPAFFTFHATSAGDAPAISFSTDAAYKDIFFGAGANGFRTGRARATLSSPTGTYKYYRVTYNGSGGQVAFTENATSLTNGSQPDTGSNANANCICSASAGASAWAGVIVETFGNGTRNWSAGEWTSIQAYLLARYALP